MSISQICIEVLCARGKQSLGEKRREGLPGKSEVREGVRSNPYVTSLM